ncbi:MAG: hypothetical protein Q7T16_01680 [Candidatus Burarchaeum sp.]|nr:hypothetical protein [Candidatus Burarchaeum sp.]MDO8339345.1 hypothetical protein [Candidatus Burarchaeum sp.]
MNFRKLAVIAPVLVLLVLAGCLGFVQRDAGTGECIGTCPFGTHQPSPTTCACVPDQWSGDWVVLSALLLLTLIFLISIFYMLATALEMPYLQMQIKDEYAQAIVSLIFLVALASMLWSINNVLLPGLAGTFGLTLTDVPGGSHMEAAFDPISGVMDPMAFAKEYTQDITDALSHFTADLEGIALEVGAASSVSTYCQILGGVLGFSIVPCSYLNSTMGTLGLLLNALYAASIAMWAQAMLLKLAGTFMILLLPLGVLLRSLRFTRSAGGALIAIAVGFYLIYPFMVIADYSFIKSDVFMPDSATAKYGYTHVYDTAIKELSVNHDLGACTGDGDYISMLTNREAFIEPMAYWIIIVSILLPVMNLLVTLTFIRWFASAIGSEIEVGQLARVA